MKKYFEQPTFEYIEVTADVMTTSVVVACPDNDMGFVPGS